MVASPAVLFQQFLDDDLGCASYLVGDEEAGVAAVVDPPYAIEPLLAEAERRGVRIVRVDRDAHARRPPLGPRPAGARARPAGLDQPRGRARVRRTTRSRTAPRSSSARSCCGRSTRPATGRSTRASPSIDRSRADEPWLVLTGDSLFVGDAGRPDLAVDAKEGAEGLFDSLRRLMELPRRRRGLPRARRRVALREGDELEGVLDDRLRAPLQRRGAARGQIQVRRRVRRGRRARSRRTWRGSWS